MFLQTGAAIAATLPVAARAAEATTARGPAVWLDLDQAALDAAYDQSNWATNMLQVIDRNTANSDVVRARIGEPLRFSYGDAAVETLDVYPTALAAAPIVIFVHGGAWRQAVAREFGFAAQTFVGAGIHYVVPDFSWVQDVGGDLSVLADQLRRALAWVYENAARFGGDRDRIYLAGHSSGAHLAGVLLTTDWPSTAGLPHDVIKHGFCASGMYDLRPVRLSARSSYISFTDAIEQELSPQRHIDRLNAPLTIAYGSLDSPEFQRQSRDFAKAVSRAGKDASLLVADLCNHMEVLETLGNPYGFLGWEILQKVGLPPA